MLITEFVEVKITKANIEHYITKGYDTELKQLIQVRSLDLTRGSHKKLEVMCDYCGDIIPKPFKEYMKQTKCETMPCCCNKCRNYKAIPTWIEKYGVSHPTRSPELQAKGVSTSLERYGTTHPQKSELVKNKVKLTNLERYGVPYYVQSKNIIKHNIESYGVEHWFQSEKFKKVAKNTNLERYGKENYTQTEAYKIIQAQKWKEYVNSEEYQIMTENRKQTNIERYGVPYIIMNPEIKRKAMLSMFKNSSVPSSKLQREICEITDGILNFPVLNCYLDIAFISEKIYIEYDGGGHNLQVRFGKLTEEEFDEKEFTRYSKLKGLGWKETRIINSKDRKIDMLLVRDFVDYAKSFLIDKNYSIHFNFDNKTILLNREIGISFEDFFTKYKIKEAIS